MFPDARRGPSAHAFPFRLVDRVSRRGPDECTVVCGVTADAFLQDDRSDPARPWPAALIVEAMLQAALPLVEGPGGAARAADDAGGGAPAAAMPSGYPPPGYVAAMEGVRLLRPVRAGDRLSITARVVGRHADLLRIVCRAVIEDGRAGVVAEGEFTVTGPRVEGHEDGRGAGGGTTDR